MKNRISFILALYFMVVCLSIAPAASANDGLLGYSEAIEHLNGISLTDVGELDLVARSLAAVGSRFYAPQYRMVVEILLLLAKGDNSRFAEMEAGLGMLSANKAFIDDYLSHDSLAFLPIEALQSYVEARRLETEGKIQEAFESYTKAQILDSLDRGISIIISQERTIDLAIPNTNDEAGTVTDPGENAQQIILEVNGEIMTKSRFSQLMQNAYNRAYMEQQLYVQYGLIPSVDIDMDQLILETLDSTAREMLVRQKGQELGLDEPTQEEMEFIQTEANAGFQEIKSQVQDYYYPNSVLSAAELNAAVLATSKELGFTLDMFIRDGMDRVMHEKLRAYLTHGLEVNEEELQARYDENVELAKAVYDANPALYSIDLTDGTVVYYTPDGYRLIKHILIKLPNEGAQVIATMQEELSALKLEMDTKQLDADEYKEQLFAEGTTNEEIVSLRAQYEARLAQLLSNGSLTDAELIERASLEGKISICDALQTAHAVYSAKEAEIASKRNDLLASLKPRADEIHAKAVSQHDFDALIKAYSEDLDMPPSGYAICATTMTSFGDSFTQSAIGLEDIGDVSQPVCSSFGWHILQYAADIREGPIPFDAVRHVIHEELLNQKVDAAYNAAISEWMASASVKKYPERVKDLIYSSD